MSNLIFTKQERDNYHKLDPAYRKDLNQIKIHKSNTYEHELAKSKVCIYLLNQNRKFITEARLKTGGRIDVFDLTYGVAYEILHTEPESNIEIKKDYYDDILILPLKSHEILEVSFEELSKFLD